MTRGLFSRDPRSVPLGERLRPRHLRDLVGQDHLFGERGQIAIDLKSGRVKSMIFWGPPGSGKTTAARLVAEASGRLFVECSAVFCGVGDLKRIFEKAEKNLGDGRETILFVDQVHRFNRAQQDAFLPVVERGLLTLIGATTENPSFALNGALISRAQVMTFRRLNATALASILKRAEDHFQTKLPINEQARQLLIEFADGDGRTLLGYCDDLFEAKQNNHKSLDPNALVQHLQRRAMLYDKSRDAHYNLISALHKALRGSDPDAALYYLARMLEGGEDPLYIVRRLVRVACEDVGLADPRALELCLQAKDTFAFLGSPEGDLSLFAAVAYLAIAPKSNAVYRAETKARELARRTGSVDPPKVILNAPTHFMKREGYGHGYQYDHDVDHAFSGQNYFPDGVQPVELYQPTERGLEARIKTRLHELKALRAARREASKKKPNPPCPLPPHAPRSSSARQSRPQNLVAHPFQKPHPSPVSPERASALPP